MPNVLIVVGAIGAIAGAAWDIKQFGYAWLVAFMFFLSICLGSLFLVLVHHLFDAGWSVPIRRFAEQIATCVFPYMAIFFIPIALLAPKLYPWMSADPHADHALHAKQPLFTMAGFYIVSAFCLAVWWMLSNRLRYWSLEQDKTGSAHCTYRMRFFSYIGIFLFAISLTLGAIMWMKALTHQWFSTMYGVYYFAGSVWTTLGTFYFITMALKRNGMLRAVLHEHQFYFLGSLLFAFTVFYAYIHFFQYFIIWNANLPEETFWYLKREAGTWRYVGYTILFGHFLIPFLALLRIDKKLTFSWMAPICVWTWVMHYVDMTFNIKPPVASPEGFSFGTVWLDWACMALIGGVLMKAAVARFLAHPPYPLKDPRMAEAMGQYHPVACAISGGEMDETDDLADSAPAGNGGSK